MCDLQAFKAVQSEIDDDVRVEIEQLRPVLGNAFDGSLDNLDHVDVGIARFFRRDSRQSIVGRILCVGNLLDGRSGDHRCGFG